MKEVVRDFQQQVSHVATPSYDRANLGNLPTTVSVYFW